MYADNKIGASQVLVYGNVAVMFLFQGFYSIAWTPLLTLYPPEVMPYATRANGNALSSFVLNGLALLLVFVMPIGLDRIGWKMYMINGSWDIIVLALIAVFWVETKGKTLEEIDALFDGGVHSTVQNVEDVRKGREILDLEKVKTDLQEEVGLRKRFD
ncbi:Lactose permease [Beauveria bassiana]|uniref:Lactose permease n=1 Tax=Beauveria bassiana TaxID=176275 RepID=A0A2N6NWY5_BEABA|nr:Lactose permease [Beauveria bassiana]